MRPSSASQLNIHRTPYLSVSVPSFPPQKDAESQCRRGTQWLWSETIEDPRPKSIGIVRPSALKSAANSIPVILTVRRSSGCVTPESIASIAGRKGSYRNESCCRRMASSRSGAAIAGVCRFAQGGGLHYLQYARTNVCRMRDSI
jgi:hypothetical protein